MKVLYVGYYKEGTGWARAAQEYILALDAVGINVVPRCIKLNSAIPEIPARIVELEKKSDKDCDIVIQHLLPYHMEYNGNFKKCIGIYESETTNFKDSGWTNRLNLMDELWVPNRQMLSTKNENHLTPPIYVVNHATDIDKYTQSYNKLDIPNIDGKFAFYFIGEANRRKNITALLRAFHTEFASNENVALVIKSSIPGQPISAVNQHLTEICTTIKRGLKIYKDIGDYSKEIIISEYLTDLQMMQLHATCDCFVCPSYGEAWCYPAFDAMAMGKPVISNKCMGMLDYIINGETGLLVENHLEPTFAALDTFENLFTSNECWYSVDILDLQHRMRQIYEDKTLYNTLSVNGIDKATEFSHKNIGARMKKLLDV